MATVRHMDEYTYRGGTLMFGGVEIGTAHSMHLSQSIPVEVAHAEPPEPFTVTAECHMADLDGFFADVRRLVPVQPSGVVTLSLPWGILGTLKLSAYVDGVTHAQKAGERATTSLQGQVDERELRREIANAVRRVIANEYARDHAVVRALEARSPVFGRMAHRMGFSRPGGCYRGERKQRKAMRRLLRAAGITRTAGE